LNLWILFLLLYSMNHLPGVVGSMVWTPSSRYGFAMKSYYTMLQSSEHLEGKGPSSHCFLLMDNNFG